LVQVTGADITGFIHRVNEMGIGLGSVTYVDFLTVKISVPKSAFSAFRNEATKRGYTVKLLGKNGLWVFFSKIRTRPVLLMLCFLLTALTVWIPKHVLFVAVEGNQSISTESILQAAETAGLFFGAKRNEVRSEIIKNRLLESIPELQWAGVNTKGCTAVIKVREDRAHDRDEKSAGYSNVVASADGIVVSLTSFSGTPVCSVGDAVKKEQVLISGYMDLGITAKVTRADGEVFAQTQRNIYTVVPLIYSEKKQRCEEITKYSLVLGKNRINLSKDSRISYAGCDKIYSNYALVLPGGFVLPVSLACERIFVGDDSLTKLDGETAKSIASGDSQLYLMNEIVSGTVLGKSEFDDITEDYMTRLTKYQCIEMIGIERAEEFRFEYGKND